jgi:hypothetical protein
VLKMLKERKKKRKGKERKKLKRNKFTSSFTAVEDAYDFEGIKGTTDLLRKTKS